MKKLSRKLDISAKAFSLSSIKNNNTFRLSVILNEKVNPNILKQAINKVIDKNPNYRVKLKLGFFWYSIKYNSNNIILEREENNSCEYINFSKNNNHLFKVTYFNNKINLDIFHVLCDGVGSIRFLKNILYAYLGIKYNLNYSNSIKTTDFIIDDYYLKFVNRKITLKDKKIKPYIIKTGSNRLINKTYHYIVELDRLKNICSTRGVTITEYLTAIYIFTIYKTIYDKASKKDILITLPIDLRKYYNVDTLVNFFTYAYINGNVVNGKNVTFDKILKQVVCEFNNKLTLNKIKQYLFRDVKIGTNKIINLVPLFIKKMVIKFFGNRILETSTTTLSNIGIIDIDKKYEKYINNIMVMVNVNKRQKIKCSICSFKNNLTITINSNLINNEFELEFYKLLNKYIGNVKIDGDKLI